MFQFLIGTLVTLASVAGAAIIFAFQFLIGTLVTVYGKNLK